MKKSNKIIIGVSAAVMAIAIFVILFVSVKLSNSGKVSNGTTSGTQATESTAPPASDATSGQAETTSDRPEQPKPDKVIALTFDDGPRLSITPQILDILEKHQAKATFFTVGYNLSEAKARNLRRALSLGCEIGNHSDTHPASLTTLSDEEILREITEVNRKITELVGFGYTPTLMRPPGGHIDRNVLDVLYAAGVRMHTILWNSDSRDWEFNKKWQDGEISYEEAVESAVSLVLSEAENGGIVLMHDIKEITPDVLDRVLDALAEEGYSFVTVSELFDFESMGEEAYFSKFYARKQVVPMG